MVSERNEHDRICPECGAPKAPYAPPGACLKCMLRQGLAPAGEVSEDAEALPAGLFPDDEDEVAAVRECPGRYTGEEEFAQGGMGRILIAHDAYLGRDIAMKELLPEAARRTQHRDTPSPAWRSSPAVARFVREARITGQLEHPSIVPVHEIGRRMDGTLYYTMKLVRGKSLSGAIEDAGSLRERLRLLPHFLDLCQAVSYAHSRGVVHRDIKPANVMVGEFGETVLLDWGLAKVFTGGGGAEAAPDETTSPRRPGVESPAGQTSDGEVLGTPSYMAPEQVAGRTGQVNERTDVYALGVVLYVLLTGKSPFQGRSSDAVLKDVLAGNRVPVPEAEPKAPGELAAVCHKAMAREPSQRYDSAKALAEEISQYLAGGLVRAYTYRLSERAGRILHRFRAVVATAAAALLLLLLGGGVYSYVEVLEERNVAQAAQKDAEDGRLLTEREEYYRTIPLAASWLKEDRHVAVAALLRGTPKYLRGWEWRYLMARTRVVEARVETHEGSLGDMALSQDGAWLVSVSAAASLGAPGNAQGEVAAFETAALGEVWRRTLPRRTLSVAVSQAANRVAVGVWEGPLYILSLDDGGILHELPVDGSCWQLCFSPDGKRLFGQWEGRVESVKLSLPYKERVRRRAVVTWNVEGLQETNRIEQPPYHGRTGLACSHDGRLLAYSDGAGNITVRDITANCEVARLANHGARVNQLVFGSPAETLLSADAAGTVTGWDLAAPSDAPRFRWSLCQTDIEALELTADGRRLVCGDADGLVRLVNADDGGVLGELQTNTPLCTLSCGSDGDLLYLANRNGTVDVWKPDVAFGMLPPEPLAELTGTGTRIRFSDDGALMVGCRQAGGAVDVWETGTFTHVSSQHVEDPTINLNAVAFVEGSHELQVPDEVVMTTLFRAGEGDQLTQFGAIMLENLNLEDTLAVLAGMNGMVPWDIEPRRPLDVRLPETEMLMPMGVVSSDEKVGVAGIKGMRDVAVTTWPEGELLFETTGQLGGATAITFHPKGDRFAVADNYGYVYLWSVRAKRLHARFHAHEGEITALVFSPDGSRLLSTGKDGTVRLWDWLSGQELLVFDNLNDYARDAAFSPDGTVLAFTDRDPPFHVTHAPL